MRSLISAKTSGSPVVMVGDRPGTDLAMAHAEGWVSVLVETGVTPAGSDVEPAPDHVIESITGLPEIVEDVLSASA